VGKCARFKSHVVEPHGSLGNSVQIGVGLCCRRVEYGIDSTWGGTTVDLELRDTRSALPIKDHIISNCSDNEYVTLIVNRTGARGAIPLAWETL
jgi:hypothetical protein